MDATTLLNGVTSTGAGDAVPVGHGGRLSFHASVAGTGAVSGTVKIQGSNDGSTWVDLSTLTLSGTDSDAAGSQESAMAYLWVRANLTAVSGTGATVTVTMGS